MSDLGALALFVAILAGTALAFAGMWKTLAKAGLPGWGAIVPAYNLYLFWKVSQSREPLLVLLFVPFVSVFALGFLCVQIAERFGRSVLFGAGLLLFPPVFWVVLGFGGSEWKGDLGGSGELDASPST
ncbi:MAG: DUF5684 domain-containing protein [Actinomycetota bacterium]